MTSANENKGGFRYVFVGEERQRVLVTQRKLKLKTLGDWEIVVAQSKDIEHTKLLRRRQRLNLWPSCAFAMNHCLVQSV